MIDDYARQYRREHRIRVVQEEKLRRIRKIVAAGLPKCLAFMAILFITRKT